MTLLEFIAEAEREQDYHQLFLTKSYFPLSKQYSTAHMIVWKFSPVLRHKKRQFLLSVDKQSEVWVLAALYIHELIGTQLQSKYKYIWDDL